MFLVVLVGCSAHAGPAEPARPIDPYDADLHVVCSAEAARARTLPELGIYLESRVTSPRLSSAVADAKVGRLPIITLFVQLQQDAAAAGIASCPVLDRMLATPPTCAGAPCRAD